jgi:hypothetical protein
LFLVCFSDRVSSNLELPYSCLCLPSSSWDHRPGPLHLGLLHSILINRFSALTRKLGKRKRSKTREAEREMHRIQTDKVTFQKWEEIRQTTHEPRE